MKSNQCCGSKLMSGLVKAELTDTQRVRIVGIVVQTSLATT